MCHRGRAPAGHRQRRLGAIGRLTAGLLVEAEHRSSCGRVEIQTDDVDEFLLEPRIVADLEGVDPPRFQLVISPNLGDRVLPDPDMAGHRPCRPVGGSTRGDFLPGRAQHARHCCWRQPRLTSPPVGDLADPVEPGLGEPDTPAMHRVRIDHRPARDLGVGQPVGRPQQRTGLHHLPVWQRRRAGNPRQLTTLDIGHRQRGSDHDPHPTTTPLFCRRSTRSSDRKAYGAAEPAVLRYPIRNLSRREQPTDERDVRADGSGRVPRRGGVCARHRAGQCPVMMP